MAQGVVLLSFNPQDTAHVDRLTTIHYKLQGFLWEWHSNRHWGLNFRSLREAILGEMGADGAFPSYGFSISRELRDVSAFRFPWERQSLLSQRLQ
jgi:hypothetical protein